MSLTYTKRLDVHGDVLVGSVLASDGSIVITGYAQVGGETVDLLALPDDDGPGLSGDRAPTEAYRAWLKAGNAPGEAVPKPREAYGDDLITALSDAELAAMAGGTMRDQRMLSAQRTPFRATDDIIVRLAAVMKVDPAAWLARVPG